MERAIVLLVLVAAAAHLCTGAVDICRDVDGFNFPAADQTAFVSYSYEPVLGVLRSCESVTQQCFATIPNERLRQRVWYLDDTKADHGFGYKRRWIQIYNIVCPPGNVLHIIPVFLDTEDSTRNGANCPNDDFITIEIPGRNAVIMCGDDPNLFEGYNNGFGLLAEGGNATVTFCSSDNDVRDRGFAVSATCIDLSNAFLPGCVNFNDKIETEEGQGFVDRIDPSKLEEVEKANILHKRNADAFGGESSPEQRHMKKMDALSRRKRFININGFETFELPAGAMVTYRNNTVTIDYNNGTMPDFSVFWLVTLNPLIGTRIFDFQAPPELELRGPGSITIYFNSGIATVKYTTGSIARLVLPNSLEAMRSLNLISNFIYRNYIQPYPFTCPPENQSLEVPEEQAPPLPFADLVDPAERWRFIKDLDFIRPDIQNGTCIRSVVPSLAPSRTSFMERNIFDFCQHFYYSCNPLVRAVCAEAVGIDRAG